MVVVKGCSCRADIHDGASREHTPRDVNQPLHIRDKLAILWAVGHLGLDDIMRVVRISSLHSVVQLTKNTDREDKDRQRDIERMVLQIPSPYPLFFAS